MSQTESASYGYVSDKNALIKRLHRIEGQVRGIERMVADERYCIDILTQISAVTTALESLGLKILGEHVKSVSRRRVSGARWRSGHCTSRTFTRAASSAPSAHGGRRRDGALSPTSGWSGVRDRSRLRRFWQHARPS